MHVDAFLSEVVAWARDRADVRAVFLVGSQARAHTPADEFSDVDIALVVDEARPFLDSDSWLEPFGEVLLTFVEETAVGGQLERRVLFRSGLEVDFALVPAGDFGGLVEDPKAATVAARGYRVLYDELGVTEDLARAAAMHETGAPQEAGLESLSHDFWYHALWAAKKLRRGEVYVAKQACDCYLKPLVVLLLEARARARNPELDTWHRARFLERWAEPDDLSELRNTFALYDEKGVARAIAATADLFERLELELIEAAQVDHAEIRRQLASLLDPYLGGSAKAVLAVDVGGSHVKALVSGQSERRRFESGPDLTPQAMVEGVLALVDGWSFDHVSVGIPAAVRGDKPVAEPVNLGKGWVGFDYEAAFGVPTKVVNDAVMQAIGSYEGGRMLFLGLGTGLGSTLIVDGIVDPLELGHLPFRKKTFEDYVGERGLERLGKKKWHKAVFEVVERLAAAIEPDYVMLGGGGADKLDELPPNCRRGDNEQAFVGGFRLWQPDLLSRATSGSDSTP
jgi:polyphosphate glucokinase